MSAITPRSSPSRVSSRKTSPSPVSVPPPNLPLPRLVSPRRTRPRRTDLHSGLCPLAEADEDTPSRCPSLYNPTSPVSETQRSSIVYTPCAEDDDPFEDCTFSPVSDVFYDDSAKHAARSLRSPIRTPTPSRLAAPYRLLPALPILSVCEQRPAPPSPPTPSSPLTPTTPGLDGMGANLVSALRNLLTSCGEYEYDYAFADAEEAYPEPVPGQFDDAVSPKSSPTLACPRTPPPQPARAAELLRAPRPRRGPRQPLAPGFNADHSVLAAMSAECRDRAIEAFEDLPPLSSSSSVSSASSLASLCGMASGMTMAPRPPVTPPRKSSRRILRSPLPLWS
ncbi:hypothetical protein CC85DRAFT_303815 [Cutaneotrichosporon oleaginosum]|uniref:Uncharacterized protein n=1 Tax=Cutaneotrichosporon oleaginosum TaxID=879819 RepID=A0A0J0XI56_9TREE|nr:uncharacterized protein CC85DRAFT_303815 [Cutaneotrichosporon oleaginosum]KLT40810.1 hypothetical protein CC85DRAFT_303815 [Cutaneotrichosporon oleaginosum]TXT11878.1 hypothetical protein COLE_02288 [Cutaneotrichosporon oleaginosum]